MHYHEMSKHCVPECDTKQLHKVFSVISYCSVAPPKLPRTIPALGKDQYVSIGVEGISVLLRTANHLPSLC